jgi:hypothetical protein
LLMCYLCTGGQKAQGQQSDACTHMEAQETTLLSLSGMFSFFLLYNYLQIDYMYRTRMGTMTTPGSHE